MIQLNPNTIHYIIQQASPLLYRHLTFLHWLTVKMLSKYLFLELLEGVRRIEFVSISQHPIHIKLQLVTFNPLNFLRSLFTFL
jgi:hypothetical protein